MLMSFGDRPTRLPIKYVKAKAKHNAIVLAFTALRHATKTSLLSAPGGDNPCSLGLSA